MLNSLRHPAVRDLYWAINSPSLINTTGVTHWQDHGDAFRQLLHQLDQQPAPLLDHLQQGHTAGRPLRLGLYFERLWHFYLRQHPDYQLLAHNLQIRDTDQRTLGELDLLIQCQHPPCTLHLELAVKFYLALPDPDAANALTRYIGPGLKDLLIRKYQHTCQHQLTLSSRQEAQPPLAHLNIQVDQAQALFRGRLFQPWTEDSGLQPAWLAQHQLPRLPGDSIYLRLERRQWFAEQLLPDAPLTSLSHQLDTPLERPVQVARIDPATGQERQRLFIVPDDWEARARQCLTH